MNIKESILTGESKTGKKVFKKMLRWLDSPKRKKYNDSEKLIASSGIQSGQAVLEIGCGSGFFTVPASKMLGVDGKLYSADIRPMSIEETQKKVDELGLKNVIVKKDDAMNSSFNDNMFDTVLLYGGIPVPVISIEDISAEICRVLKPGGVLAVWTMVSFWIPKNILKSAPFELINKNNNVFRLKKV